MIEAVLREQVPMHERAQKYIDAPGLVGDILEAGRVKATALAEETMREVRDAMGLGGA